MTIPLIGGPNFGPVFAMENKISGDGWQIILPEKHTTNILPVKSNDNIKF
jgi:hypothetical protein